ncbi:MAG: hypothetical protein ACOYNU_15605, partial [Bacteroidales bacterium]
KKHRRSIYGIFRMTPYLCPFPNPITMTPKKIKAIITGATGMVGEGVLYEALQHPDVDPKKVPHSASSLRHLYK